MGYSSSEWRLLVSGAEKLECVRPSESRENTAGCDQVSSAGEGACWKKWVVMHPVLQQQCSVSFPSPVCVGQHAEAMSFFMQSIPSAW